MKEEDYAKWEYTCPVGGTPVTTVTLNKVIPERDLYRTDFHIHNSEIEFLNFLGQKFSGLTVTYMKLRFSHQPMSDFQLQDLGVTKRTLCHWGDLEVFY